ncbi:MAG: pyridoxamine 5'-phosphate oxidase family protein [Actinomycetota bacterium]
MAERKTAEQLSGEALAALRTARRIVAIVATIDEDGWPRTAAFGSVRAVSGSEIRFACNRTSTTYANLVRDGRLMIALQIPPNISLGIKGRAAVLKQTMESLPTNALIQVMVELVKNDSISLVVGVSGTSYQLTPEAAKIVDRAFEELESE